MGYCVLACFLDWGVYRERIDLKTLTNLTRLLDVARTDNNFIKTVPPTQWLTLTLNVK